MTSAWITSSLFNVYVDEAPACLSGLAQILIGGEALSPSHVRRALDYLPGVRLVNGYGPTENTTFTCCHVIRPRGPRSEAHDADWTPDCEHDSSRSRLRWTPCPGRNSRRAVAGGDGVALGYVGQPETNRTELPPRHFSGRTRCPPLPFRRSSPLAARRHARVPWPFRQPDQNSGTPRRARRYGGLPCGARIRPSARRWLGTHASGANQLIAYIVLRSTASDPGVAKAFGSSRRRAPTTIYGTNFVRVFERTPTQTQWESRFCQLCRIYKTRRHPCDGRANLHRSNPTSWKSYGTRFPTEN